MFIYLHQQRVRYSDTDQMGYVYYANYGFYYEQARAEAVRSLGIAYKDLEAGGTIMPVTRMNIKYIQPAHYDDLLTIKTIIPELPGRMMMVKYEIYNEKNQLINKGDTSMIFADAISGQIKTAPPVLIEKLRLFFEEKRIPCSEQIGPVINVRYLPLLDQSVINFRKTA